jgi:3-hydroxyisobutyrate dehydrogenase
MAHRVGFLGLGLMGRPMAFRLLRAGYPVTVWNRTIAKSEGFAAEGAHVATSPAQVAQQSDVLVTIVTGPEALHEILHGDEGLLATASPGSTLIDMSTIGLDATHAVADACRAQELHFLDAPVTGSVPGAENGTLTIMVGGAREVFECQRKLMQVLGTPTYVGPQGMGALVKLGQNLIGAAIVEGVAEAMHLAKAHGLSRKMVSEVLQQTGVSSRFLKLKAEKMVAEDYRPQFTVANMAKDIGLALDAASGKQLPLPMAQRLLEVYQQAVDEGFGEEDYAALVKRGQS